MSPELASQTRTAQPDQERTAADENSLRAPDQRNERRARPRHGRSLSSSSQDSFEFIGSADDPEGRASRAPSGKPRLTLRTADLHRHSASNAHVTNIPVPNSVNPELNVSTPSSLYDEGIDDAYPPSTSTYRTDEPHSHEIDIEAVPTNRLPDLRDLKLHHFGFPTNFRVLYVGTPTNEKAKSSVFYKLSEALSQIFWEEASSASPPHDVGPEKKLVICPVTNFPESKPEVEFYQDSGVAVTEADFTNRPYKEAFNYLEAQFAKKENNDDLIDLCVCFIPQDPDRFPDRLLPTMKKLQEKVTLLPLLPSGNHGLNFADERAARRRKLEKMFEAYGIEIFVWKDDKLVLDYDNELKRDKWVKTVFTKGLLTVDEFVEMDPVAIFEDLQLLRSRALELRKVRDRQEAARRRTQSCEKVSETARSITIMLCILYVIYLFFYGMWRYAEWSVMPSDLRDSLRVVSTAYQGYEAGTAWQPTENSIFEDSSRPEVYQLSRTRFIVETDGDRQSQRGPAKAYEVVVLHNAAVLRRQPVNSMGNGQYTFDIDTSGARGEVLVELREKNGDVVRIVPWSPNVWAGQSTGPSTGMSERAPQSLTDYTMSLGEFVAGQAHVAWKEASAVCMILKNQTWETFSVIKREVVQVVENVREGLNEWVPWIMGKTKELASYLTAKARRGAGRIKAFVK